MKVLLPTLEPSFNMGPCSSSHDIFCSSPSSVAARRHSYHPYQHRNAAFIPRQPSPNLSVATSSSIVLPSISTRLSSPTFEDSISTTLPSIQSRVHQTIELPQHQEIIFQSERQESNSPTYSEHNVSPAPRTASPTSPSSPISPGSPLRKGIWLYEEHEQFLKGYAKYGNDWKKVSEEFVPTRSRAQLASHAQKYFSKVKKVRELSATEKQSVVKKTRSLFCVDQAVKQQVM